jgi:alpha-L-rhamnosidase
MNVKKIIFLFSILGSPFMLQPQQPVEELNYPAVKYKVEHWNAYWITNPDIHLNDYSVVLFRRNFEMTAPPPSFIIHVTADTHYELFVNGKFICSGPARGDLQHWRYETVDIASFLKPGENVIAAQVVNWGQERMKACFSAKTGFLLQGSGSREAVVNTDDKNWKTFYNTAFSAKPVKWMYQEDIVHGWYCANPCDSINGFAYPWGWREASFDDKSWKNAQWLATPAVRETGQHGNWLLIPRTIQLLSQSKEEIPNLVSSEGMELRMNPFTRNETLTIPAHSKVTLLFDNLAETVGYPVIVLNSGKQSQIKISYAENLFTPDRHKVNRNITSNMEFIGYGDVYITDGGTGRCFSPTWHRAFRYIQMEIETGKEPLEIADFFYLNTHYPVTLKARFDTDNQTYSDIFSAAYRTARICAQDILMSDAYYETMQYIADTRIHALTLFAATGDVTLWREAIRHFDNSRIPEGLTLAAYPNDWYWVLPFFSMVWVNMVYDYTMATGDMELAHEMVNGTRALRNWFDSQIDDTGMLGHMPWANPNGAAVHSANFTLSYAYTLNNLACVYEYIGCKEDAEKCREEAKKIDRDVHRQCWVAEKGLMAETPEKTDFNYVATVMGVLSGAVPKDKQKAAIEKVIDNYVVGYQEQFYLLEAVKKTGLGGKYEELMKPWKMMLDDGLTTFAEVPGNPRSDCHPWTTSPVWYDFSIVCGIEPLMPGYKKVLIAPEPGNLQTLNASFPSPNGAIELKMNLHAGQKATVVLPAETDGIFRWRGKEYPLTEGEQLFDIQPVVEGRAGRSDRCFE